MDAESARQALIYSFGSEVIQKFEHDRLTERIQQGVEQILENAGMM